MQDNTGINEIREITPTGENVNIRRQAYIRYLLK